MVDFLAQLFWSLCTTLSLEATRIQDPDTGKPMLLRPLGFLFASGSVFGLGFAILSLIARNWSCFAGCTAGFVGFGLLATLCFVALSRKRARDLSPK